MSKTEKIVIIGISAGGPPTLRILLPYFNTIKAPIIIVQHIPGSFTDILIQNLKIVVSMPIIKLDNYVKVNDNAIYFCPGGYHTIFKLLKGQVQARLYSPEKGDIVAPSIDKAMISIAQIFEGSVLGIIMTGMTGDGVEGISKIKSMGGITIAQNEKSSVIFGMPKRAIESGCIDHICDVNGIARKIDQFMNKGD